MTHTAKKSAVGEDNTGALLGGEYTKGKWWYAVDYLSSDNAIGSLNTGVAYSFAPNTSVIFGYDKYNAFNANPWQYLDIDLKVPRKAVQ